MVLEPSPPVPRLLLGAQTGRQVLLARLGWVSWILLALSPGTPTFTHPAPKVSPGASAAQHCPALPSPSSCPLGARVPLPSNEEPFPQSRWVQASLLRVKRVQLNSCTLTTALLTSAVLGSLLSLRQHLTQNVPLSWGLPCPPRAVVIPWLRPA